MSAPVAANLPRVEPLTVLSEEPSRRETMASWGFSVLLHGLLLAAIAPIHFASEYLREAVSAGVSDPVPVDPFQQETFRLDAAVNQPIGGDVNTGQPGDQVAALGPATAIAPAPAIEVPTGLPSLAPSSMSMRRPMIDSVAATPDRELSELLQTTGTTEHPGGVRGALDRLTLEIEASLRQENTLVVWLFDASISLKPRRDQIADRFDNIYRQLGLRGVGGDGALKTVVATFGNKIEYLTTKPVDNVESIQKAIRKIKDDDDGVENIFGAVLDAGRKFRSFRTSEKDHRRVMMIVVTDERGDDVAKLEEAIARLSKIGMRVYCVGDDAVFGRQHHMVPWTYADGFREMIPVDRGPETVAPESVQLAFWGRDSNYMGELTSGFGPYGLCRLCAETGGLYLISDELPGPRFDAELLRNYLPDYRPIREYEAELNRNAAKASLVRAASLPGEQIPQPATVFRADKDTTLRQQITEAQKPLAVLDYRLNELELLLDAGEKDRPKLTSPRWRASFDLAAGRVLAMRARSLGYNVMLAEMKSAPRPFEQNGHNTWRIISASEDTTPLRIQKLAHRAKQYLEAVVEEHRGTQWEMLAREELKEPMGWRWESFFVDYPPPAPPRMPSPRTPADDNAEQMRRQREQQRVRPKL